MLQVNSNPVAGLHLAGVDNAKPAGASGLEYLLTVSAVKRASSLFPDAQHHSADKLASISAPAALLTWLQQQPSDVVTKGCQAAARKGSLALTSYLLNRSACCTNSYVKCIRFHLDPRTIILLKSCNGHDVVLLQC